MKNFFSLIPVIMLSQQLNGQSLSIDGLGASECQRIAVSYEGFPVVSSAKGNWIALAEAGSPASVMLYRFQYLPAQSSGKIFLSTRGLIPFKEYEVRGFVDWDRTHSYSIVARAEVAVLPNPSCRKPMILSHAGTVEAGSPLQFVYEGLKRSDSNWVAIARQDQTAPNFLKSKYLVGGGGGDATIDTQGLAPGDYELRLFEDWAKTKEYFIYDRVSFIVR